MRRRTTEPLASVQLGTSCSLELPRVREERRQRNASYTRGAAKCCRSGGDFQDRGLSKAREAVPEDSPREDATRGGTKNRALLALAQPGTASAIELVRERGN